MNHVRTHHPGVRTHTREKKDAKGNLVANKGGKTSQNDQPSIKGKLLISPF